MVGFSAMDTPIRDFRPFRVIVIGAGLTGIHMAARFRQYGYGINLQIYERNPECGGTWYNNQYPGVACDVPSHAYTLSWAPWSEWKTYFAPGEDCLEYARFAAKKAHLDDHTRYNTNLLSAIWNETEGMWEVTLEDTKTGKKFTDRSNVLINCGGILSRPKFPNVPGREKFKGKILHSALWDKSVSLEGKRIALVGAGSSAMQILSKIHNTAGHVDEYIRSDTYVSPPLGPDIRMNFFDLTIEETFLGDDPSKLNPAYTEEHKAKFRQDPKFLQDHRKAIAHGVNKVFSDGLTRKDSQVQTSLKKRITEITISKFQKKPELVKYFTPTWAVGCRRLTPAIGYVEAVQAENVDVIPTSVIEVTETGLKGKDGKHRDYDVIIFATGFDTSYRPPFKIVGRDNATLNTEEFERNPKSYLAVHYANMPNYFITGGPTAPNFNGDALPCLEKGADYIFKFVIKLQRDRYKSVCVKPEVVDDYIDFVDKYLEESVHNDGCSSWYKNGSVEGIGGGKTRSIWPGSSVHFFEALDDPRWEEFDWERYPSEQNGPGRFKFFGNGKTVREEYGGNLGYYILPVAADNKEVPLFDPKEVSPGIPHF